EPGPLLRAARRRRGAARAERACVREPVHGALDLLVDLAGAGDRVVVRDTARRGRAAGRVCVLRGRGRRGAGRLTPPTRTDFPRTPTVREGMFIALADGTRLAARVWLPEDADA